MPPPRQPEGVTVTATTTAGHPPVLRFDSQPDGGPPPILCTSGHDYAFRPAGGPPILVLRRLRTYRQRIAGLFSRRAAEATRPLAQALARHLAAALHGRATADALT